MRVVVTGATGFIGSHLVDRLLERGDEVHAWVRAESANAATLPDAVIKHEVDLLLPQSVTSGMSRSAPEAIYHLAAQSLLGVSWQHPWATFEINVAGTLNLLDAARDVQFVGPITVFGSSSEYADQADRAQPMTEDYPTAANSPYAASKVASSRMATLYHRRYGLLIMVARPFFWVGTRKTGDFCSDVARKIVLIESGTLDVLPVGNLNVVRDFLDVRDGVEAVLALSDRGRAGEVYNICSGVGTALYEVIETYRSQSHVAFKTLTDPMLVRPIDEPIRTGDPTKVMALGWRPRRSLPESLSEIIQYWRGRT